MIKIGSLLGLHSIRPTHETEAWIAQCAEAGAPLSVVKSLGDADLLVAAKRLSPSTVTVFRNVGQYDNPGDQYLGLDTPALEAMADRQLAWHLGRLSAAQLAATDYIGIINEPSPPTVEGWINVARLMIVCMEKAARLNLKLGLFSFNFGMPEWDVMQAIVGTGVFAVAQRCRAVLDLHEGVEEGQAITHGWPSGIPGAPNVRGAGATCFRYRYWAEALRYTGQSMIPVIVSEMYPGTRDPVRAREALAWYDREMGRDDYAIGVTPFTVDPTDDWRGFDLTDAYRKEVVAYIIRERNRKNGAEEMNESDLLLALSAQVESVRDHLTQAINHIVEIGKISDALGALPTNLPPAVPWWELLQEPILGAPKAKVWAVENHLTHSTTVPVYKSAAADQPPSFADKDTRTKQRGESVEVWHAVAPGSKWICTFDGPSVGIAGLVLWMWADDCAKDKPS